MCIRDSNNALAFPWAYLKLQENDFKNIVGGRDYFWSVYSSSGLIISKAKTNIFDIVFAPVPGYESLGKQAYVFSEWSSSKAGTSNISFETTVDGRILDSNGKEVRRIGIEKNFFLNEPEYYDGNSKVTITPVFNNEPLKEDEYLLVYFEIDQNDGNRYKEIVVLHEAEESIKTEALKGGAIDSYGINAKYGHWKFNNGNILLRSRYADMESRTKFWLLFKSLDPITLNCYKRTITATGSGYDTSGAATADLKFIYADTKGNKVEELYRVSASDNGTVPNNQEPYTPSNPTPSHNSTNISSDNVTLSWTGGDPDGDNVTSIVYFSDSDINITSSANILYYPYTPTVINGKTYYWQVVSTDGLLTTEGPTWSFTVSDNTTPVETEAVEFFDKDNNSIPTTGLSLKKDGFAVVTVKIDPPHSNLTFELESSDSERVKLSATSLDFISTSSPTLTFKVTALDDITTPVTIFLKTENSTYLKSDGTPYTLTITGNNPPQITSNGGGDTAVSIHLTEKPSIF